MHIANKKEKINKNHVGALDIHNRFAQTHTHPRTHIHDHRIITKNSSLKIIVLNKRRDEMNTLQIKYHAGTIFTGMWSERKYTS